MPPKATPLLDKYLPEPNSGCWLWMYACDVGGYGVSKTRENGKIVMRKAHRLVYELLVGPVPVGMTLDHLCRVRSCVNPSHLEPVTITDNIRRGKQTHITLEQARQIKATSGDIYGVAKRYGLSIAQVSRIRNGRRWSGI